MAEYKCFDCGKIVAENFVRKSVRCPYCGSKILFKPSAIVRKIKAR